ncbi:MAG: hypothetical protein KIT81_12450 [Alphaproteobacteria bacterium]|nr:hypothetical protein [Alphaproteobacteria bacterium]
MLRAARPLALVALLALPCLAAAPGAAARSGGIGGADDRDKPVEITADSLEVQRDRQTAIFRGNVQAVQGSTRMRADSMVVYYRDRAQQDAARQQAEQRGEEIRGGRIARIDAFGKVFISSEGETAQGDKMVYDLDRRILSGEGRVVLTRESDVLNCARLTINLETRQNVCESAPGGRVQGIFNVGREKPGATN